MKNVVAKLLISSLFITVLFNSCIPDAEELLYPGFTIITVHSVGTQTKPVFQITGEITQIREGVTLSDYGIVFMDTHDDTYIGITLDDADYTSSLGIINSAGVFTLNVDIIAGDIGTIVLQGKNVSYRAYATYDGKTVYSDEAFSFNYAPSIIATLDKSKIVTGVDRAQISYSIIGNDILQYGICWSNEAGVVPTIDNSKITNTGTPPSREGGLTINLNQLEKGKTYAVRAYGKDSDNNVYYSSVSNFNTPASGWQWGPTDLTTTTATGLVSFSIGNKGYFGLGVINGTANLQCWQYDVTTDKISTIADFPGVGRTLPLAFTIGNKAYIGLGAKFDDKTPLIDFWEYDPESDTWSRIANFTGETRFFHGNYPAVFSTDSYGYVGLGTNIVEEYTSSFMKYDPTSNNWSSIASYPESMARYVIGGSVGNLGIVGLGENTSGMLDSFWGYDEISDSWTALVSLPVRPDAYFGYKVGDRQFLFGSVSESLPIHVEYEPSTPASPWVYQGIPILLAEDPSFINPETITIFSLNDRVVFFDYGEGVSLEYLPTN